MSPWAARQHDQSEAIRDGMAEATTGVPSSRVAGRGVFQQLRTAYPETATTGSTKSAHSRTTATAATRPFFRNASRMNTL